MVLSPKDVDGRRISPIKVAVLFAVVAVFVATRLWHLTVPCLWFDELFSIHAARHATTGGLLRFVAQDIIHPPLFYVLLRWWITIGGESLLWLRLLPVLFAVASIVPFLLLCRELKLTGAETTLALMLVATNNYLIKYAQILRMYSLLIFLSLCSLWLFARFTNGDSSAAALRKFPAALFVINLLLVYTHYYGWLLIAVELLFLLLSGKRREMCLFAFACILIALVFSVWALTVASVMTDGALAQNLGWAERPHLPHLLTFYATLVGLLDFRRSTPTAIAPIGLVLFSFPVLVWMWSALKRRGETNERAALLWWLACFSFLPVMIALLLSNLLPQSIWGVRHLVLVAAPSLMLVAVAVLRLPFTWLRNGALLIISCWIALAGLAVAARGDGDYVWCAWDSLVREAVRATPTSDEKIKIYAFEELVAYHVWFTIQDAERGAERFQVSAVKGVDGLTEDPAYFLPRGFADVTIENISVIDEDRFWIAFRSERWDAARAPVSVFVERGYKVERVLSLRAFGGEAFLVLLQRGS